MTVKRTTQQIMPPARWIASFANQVVKPLGLPWGWKSMWPGVTQQLSCQFCDHCSTHHQVPSVGSSVTWWHLVTPAIGVPAGAYGSSQCIANVAHVQELRMHENEAWKGPLWAIDWSWFFLPKWSRKKTAEMHWKSLTCAFWHFF